MSMFSKILLLVCRKVFLFFIRFSMKLFPIAVVSLLYKNLIIYLSSPSTSWHETFLSNLDWSEQYFTHQVTIFVSSKCFFGKLKNVLTKHFPKIQKQPFPNVLQNRCSNKFPIFARKYLYYGLFLIKLQVWNFIKKEIPTQVSACEYQKNFKNSFFMEHLRWLLLKMAEEFLRITNLTLERFVQ